MPIGYKDRTRALELGKEVASRLIEGIEREIVTMCKDFIEREAELAPATRPKEETEVLINLCQRRATLELIKFLGLEELPTRRL